MDDFVILKNIKYYVDDTFNIAFEKSGDVSTLVFTQDDNIGFTAVYTELENGGNLTIVGKFSAKKQKT